MKTPSWKGLAVLLALCAGLAHGRPAAGTARGYLAKVSDRGGMCPGGECSSELLVEKDGAYALSRRAAVVLRGRLNGKDLAALKAAVRAADFEAVMRRRFSGTCPTAFDGQERTYAFETAKGAVAIPSCTYNVDRALPVFKLLDELMAKVGSAKR